MYIYKNKIKCFIKNNKSKTTILFIHGFGASDIFAKKLYTLNNKYNIVSMNLYDETKPKQINFSKMIKSSKKILNKIKSKNIILFGYSLGGGIISNIYKNNKYIKKIVWMSTIHPNIINDFTFSSLKKHHNETGNKLLQIITNKLEKEILKLDPSSSKYWIRKFIEKNSNWSQVLKDTIFNTQFLKHLNEAYVNTKDISTYIIGEKDVIINTKTFINFLKTINKTPNIIGIKHNPIKDDPKKINKLLNSLVETKKMFFKKRIFKF